MGKIMWLAPLLALALVACGKEQSVDRPLAEVYTMLASLPADADAMALATTLPGTSYWVEPAGATRIVWHFVRENGEYGRYVAELSEDGPNRTTVSTYVEDGSSDTNLYFLRDMARIAGDASITAALQGRSVDRAAVEAELRQLIIDNPMAAQMAVIETVADEMDRLAPPDPCDDPSGRLRDSPVCQDSGTGEALKEAR